MRRSLRVLLLSTLRVSSDSCSIPSLMSARTTAASAGSTAAPGWSSLLSAAAAESASIDSASTSAHNTDSASSSSSSVAHLLYRDVLQSVLSWLPLTGLAAPSRVCARWHSAVRGECAARALRQKAELSAAMAMMQEDATPIAGAAAIAGANRLARLIRSVPAEDWPRSRDFVGSLRSSLSSLVPLVSHPSPVVCVSAALAVVASLDSVMDDVIDDPLLMESIRTSRALVALGAFVCTPVWAATAELMSADERVQLCAVLVHMEVIDAPALTLKPRLSDFLLGCCLAANDEQLRALLRAEVIAPLCFLLQAADPNTILESLSALSRFLSLGKSDMALASSAVNAVVDAVEECAGLDQLEALQAHEDEAVYHSAINILQRFFMADEEDGPNAVDQPFNFLAVDNGQQFTFGGSAGEGGSMSPRLPLLDQ